MEESDHAEALKWTLVSETMQNLGLQPSSHRYDGFSRAIVSDRGFDERMEVTDQILSPTFKLSTVARTTKAGTTLLSLTRPAFTKNGSETPVVLPARPLSHVFRLPLIPPFSGGGSPSWSSNCYIVGKRGSRVSFNRSGRSATTAILWDRVPAFLGMSIGSAYTSGRYVPLVASSLIG
ncbi:hypothetical protein WN943_005905 [Citrus x changshan-huyou]